MAQVSLYTMLAAGPVVYMLNSIAPQLREAAMTLKAPPLVVFWRIVFPLTLPGVVIGQVLVFLNVMSDFATVATIGGNKHALLSNLVLLFYEGSQHPRRLGRRRAADDLHAGRRRDRLARRRHPPPGSGAMRPVLFGWKFRLSLTGWILGTLTVVFLAYQWLPIFTLGLLSFSGPTGGTTFPMNGTSFHWYEEVWRATVMNDFKPPLVRSSLLALACSVTTIVLSVMAAQAMRGQFRGNGRFFYLMLLGIMAPGILVGFGFAIMMRLLGVELAWDTTTFLVQVSWTLPFGFLTMLAVFNRFDKRVEEAALTLGASRLTTFRRITLPLVLPGVIGAGLFGFSLCYDEYPRSMFTTGPDATLPLAVMAQLDRQLTPEIYAIGTTTTLFSLIAVTLCTFGLLGDAAIDCSPPKPEGDGHADQTPPPARRRRRGRLAAPAHPAGRSPRPSRSSSPARATTCATPSWANSPSAPASRRGPSSIPRPRSASIACAPRRSTASCSTRRSPPTPRARSCCSRSTSRSCRTGTSCIRC